MHLVPLNAAFESLANSPLPGVRFGDLALIHEPGVNMVVGDRTFSPAVRRYLADIDVTSALSADKSGNPKVFLGYLPDVAPGQLRTATDKLFSPLLPAKPQWNTFLDEMSFMLGEASRTFNGISGCTDALDLILIGNRIGSAGVAHADMDKEIQGLITFPTRQAQGTLIVDQKVLTNPFPPPVRLDGITTCNGFNSYGRPVASRANEVRQAPVGRMAYWKGTASDLPRLHLEPDVTHDNAARLTLLFEPSVMLRRAQARHKERTPQPMSCK